MSPRIVHIARNTFREAVRDRVLYNLIAFALLLSGAAIFVGQISIDIERLVVVNLGLTAVSLFGVVIAIFICARGSRCLDEPLREGDGNAATR